MGFAIQEGSSDGSRGIYIKTVTPGGPAAQVTDMICLVTTIHLSIHSLSPPVHMYGGLKSYASLSVCLSAIRPKFISQQPFNLVMGFGQKIDMDDPKVDH